VSMYFDRRRGRLEVGKDSEVGNGGLFLVRWLGGWFEGFLLNQPKRGSLIPNSNWMACVFTDTKHCTTNPPMSLLDPGRD